MVTFPFVFVSSMFMIFRIEIKRQNKKIKELENKIKK
jgi:uncharacterized membrane protein YciS (DUF1049 family)